MTPPMFKVGGGVWSCNQDRVEVIGETNSYDPGMTISLLLSVLTHTPVSAVGNNFFYHPPEDVLRQAHALCGTALAGRLSEQGFMFDSQKVILSEIQPDGSKLSLQLPDKNDPHPVVRINIHRSVAKTSEACAVAARWSEDKHIADKVWKGIFKALEDRNGDD